MPGCARAGSGVAEALQHQVPGIPIDTKRFATRGRRHCLHEACSGQELGEPTGYHPETAGGLRSWRVGPAPRITGAGSRTAGPSRPSRR